MEKRCYQLLGLHPGASPAEIRSAFHRLARRCHPDTAASGAADPARFQELLAAYHLLKAGQVRSRYAGWRTALGLRWRVWLGFLRQALRSLGQFSGHVDKQAAKPSERVGFRVVSAATWRRNGSCWPSFAEVLAARQRSQSSCYVLCQDGIIRKTNRSDEQAWKKTVRDRKPRLQNALRSWWGVLILLTLNCWELFRR